MIRHKLTVDIIIKVILFLIPFYFPLNIAIAQSSTPDPFSRVEIASSFNPVGSGARALGMGGAFISIADDATAASWNPARLVWVERPELSIVGKYSHVMEDITWDGKDMDNQTVSITDLNYFSVNWVTDRFFPYNMAFSINYQHLYDMTRKWNFSYGQIWSESAFSTNNILDYQQEGGLSAIGLAYSVILTPDFSVGVTLNIWNDDLSENNWTQTTYQASRGSIGDNNISAYYSSVDKFSLSGVNANFGILWKPNWRFAIGAVLKTPFPATIDHEHRLNSVQTATISEPEEKVLSATLKMPMSYGIGLSYRFTNNLTAALDIYRTEWDNFEYEEESKTTSAITGKVDSDISPTVQVRMGLDYRMNVGDWVVPLRAGLFYDPAPAEGNPDDIYGVSLGFGVTRFFENSFVKGFSFDAAWQYRRGEDINEYILQDIKFSENLQEHSIYSSLIFYF